MASRPSAELRQVGGIVNQRMLFQDQIQLRKKRHLFRIRQTITSHGVAKDKEGCTHLADPPERAINFHSVMGNTFTEWKFTTISRSRMNH
jgi:hypothetical protein